MKKSAIKNQSRESTANEVGPKAKLHAGWTYFGETLSKVVQLQSAHAQLPVEQQMSYEGLLQKLRIYEDAFPHLTDAFEQLADPILAKQAGGRPSKDRGFLLAWDIARTYFEKNGRDLTGENLSRLTSRKLQEIYPDDYKKNLGWEAIGEEDIARPFPTRTASDCLMCLRVSRAFE